MLIQGYVSDKNKSPISNALIELKGENFVTLFSTQSNENGYYKLEVPADTYPFLTAVKDYAINCLEYWCQNISLKNNLELNVSFDTLEIYGLHVFTVKGGNNSLMAYFRPMSLPKFKQGAQDIAPDNIAIKAIVDNQEAHIISVNPVQECIGEQKMSAYLIQIETTNVNNIWHKFELQIRDTDNNYGAAAIFNIKQ